MAYNKPYTVDPTSGGDTVKDAIATKVEGNATQIVADLNTHDVATTAVHGVGAGTLVGTALSQTLTSKTLTSPVLNTGVSGSAISTSTALGTSDTIISSQNAVKTYADLKLAKASNLSDLANAGTARGYLGVAIGSDVQAYDATLAGLAALTTTSSAADKIPFFTGVDTFDTCAFTTTARALVDDVGVTAMQSTLGIGSAGLVSTGAFDAVGTGAGLVSSHAAITSAAHGISSNINQALLTTSSPTFVGATLSGATASLPLFTGASKELVSKSVADTQTALAIPAEGAWVNYTSTSTVVGWSSWSVKAIYYKQIGKLVFLTFALWGTSDSATTTFSLPSTPVAGSGYWVPIMCLDVGAALTGRMNLTDASATVVFYKNLSGDAFTNSGSKGVWGQFFYVVA